MVGKVKGKKEPKKFSGFLKVTNTKRWVQRKNSSEENSRRQFKMLVCTKNSISKKGYRERDG